MSVRCPICQSPDVYLITGGVCGQIYRCRSCQYQGSFVVEEVSEEQNESK